MNIDLTHLEDKYFIENIYRDIEEYEIMEGYTFNHNHCRTKFMDLLHPMYSIYRSFKDLYGYEIILDTNTGLITLSEDCQYLKPIDITYIDPIPMKTRIEQIKKEMETQLNDALHYDDVYHYTYNPKYGKVVASGFGGSAWYEFQDGTVKTYLELLSEGVKF